jgi:S1/P1 Nuclease
VIDRIGDGRRYRHGRQLAKTLAFLSDQRLKPAPGMRRLTSSLRGNDVKVSFHGYSTNLHAVWDTGIVELVLGPDERSYALQLVKDVTPGKRDSWSKGNPAAWANEGHEIAAHIIYELPHAATLPDSYEAEVLPIVNEQLERAGVRLAKVLNDCLR